MSCIDSSAEGNYLTRESDCFHSRSIVGTFDQFVRCSQRVKALRQRSWGPLPTSLLVGVAERKISKGVKARLTRYCVAEDWSGCPLVSLLCDTHPGRATTKIGYVVSPPPQTPTHDDGHAMRERRKNGPNATASDAVAVHRATVSTYDPREG